VGGFFVPGRRPEPVAGHSVRDVREQEKTMSFEQSNNPNSPGFDADLRNEICDWLRANGIDPTLVPAEERPTCSYRDGGGHPYGGHTITTRVRIRLALDDPHAFVTRHMGDRLEEATVTTRMKVPPSAAVQAWLDSHCPTCGR
jgi:hypothetical protein